MSDDNFKTSQDIWSLTEGQGGAGAPAVQYGSETSGAPGPVTEPVKGEIKKIDVSQTSQQKEADHATSESED